MTGKISNEEFELEIIRLFKKYNIVNKNIWKENSIYCDRNFDWYRNKCGGIKNILNKHGLKYRYYNEPTKDDVENIVLRLYNEHGYLNKDLCTKNGVSSSTVRRLFGNFNNMFNYFDLPVKMPRNVEKKEVVSDILNFINKHNSTSSTLYRKYGKYSSNLILKFGGWESILSENGITPSGNSQAENIIKGVLEARNIEYFIHYNFEWLKTKDGNNMYVDFYLPSLNMVIEYDGEQHYKFVPYFHKTIENYNICKERDLLKENLLKKNGITVKRIIYSDDILLELEKLLN